MMAERVSYRGHDGGDSGLDLELFVVANEGTTVSLEFSRRGKSLGVTAPRRLPAAAKTVTSTIQGRGSTPVVTLTVVSGQPGRDDKVGIEFDVEPVTLPEVPGHGTAALSIVAAGAKPNDAARPRRDSGRKKVTP